MHCMHSKHRPAPHSRALIPVNLNHSSASQLSYLSTRMMTTTMTMVKVKWIYTALSRESSKALRHGSHSVTCNYTDACLYLVYYKRSPDDTSSD